MAAERYLPYPQAMALLEERLNAQPEELAAWIWMAPENGGIAAYLHANELDDPPRFHFPFSISASDDEPGSDYLSPLMGCWFRADDIDRFEPADRFITSPELSVNGSCRELFRLRSFGKTSQRAYFSTFIQCSGSRSGAREMTPIIPLKNLLYSPSMTFRQSSA